MQKNSLKHTIIVTIVSLVLIAYFHFGIVPFANAHSFFSEGTTPSDFEKIIYALMLFPIYLGYIVYLKFVFNKIKYIRCLIYPLIATTIYLGLFLALLVAGGSIIWLVIGFLMIFGIPFVIVNLVGFGYGLYLDIKDFKNSKQ